MNDEDVLRAAALDPETRPRSPSELKRVPMVRSLRRTLALTQEDFAARFHIPIGTLRDWEQGRSEPDQPAKTLLRLIADNPTRAAKILNATIQPAKKPEKRTPVRV
jgi:putative transcriptional regulator